MSSRRSRKILSGLPAYTFIGLLIMVIAQLGLIMRIAWVATWLTPIMWSGYILFVDGLVYQRNHASWLTTRKLEFPLLVFFSIGIWLLFEAYNFHIQNWFYDGVPNAAWMRNVAYAWSFATIIPGVFLTSELIISFLPPHLFKQRKPSREKVPGWSWFLSGLVLVLIPLALPIPIARYLFGAVWLGFFLLLDPINAKLGRGSLKQRWLQGDRKITFGLLLGGLLCGFLWEGWNYQAFRLGGGHWIYTVPEPLRIQGLHYGQMPILGMLGFPPFALELYVMYHFLRSSLEIERFLGSPTW